jgi:tetratricopeptide (TPR) repeat protein
MVCKQCGAQLLDEYKFCLKCGASTQEPVIQPERKLGVTPLNPIPEKKLRETTQKKQIAIAIAAFLIIVIIAVVIIAVTIMNSPVNTFEKGVTNGNYESALKIYDDKISGNKKDEATIQEYLTTQIAEIVTQFDNKSLTYSDANKSLKSISDLGIFAGTELTDAYSHIEKLDASRTAFAAAEKLLASQDYVGAIGQYQAVITTDENYAAAQSQLGVATQDYRTATLAQANQLAAQNSFDQAITVINAALKTIPKDSELLQQLTLCESQKAAYEKATALSSAEEYMGQSEYEKALDVISAALVSAPEDADLQNAQADYQTKYIAHVKDVATVAFGIACDYEAASKIIQAGLDVLPGNADLLSTDAAFQTQYVSMVITSADTAFAADHNYETAVAAMNAALTILPNNTTLNAKKNDYLSYKPVWLTDLDYFNSSNAVKIDDFSVMKENTGTGHAHSISSNTYSEASIEYLLNGNYSKFTFTCAVPYDRRSTTYTQYVEVYGDGVLLCSTNIMTGGVDPQPVSIDITGVKKMKLVFSATNFMGDNIAAVWDPQLSK